MECDLTKIYKRRFGREKQTEQSLVDFGEVKFTFTHAGTHVRTRSCAHLHTYLARKHACTHARTRTHARGHTFMHCCVRQVAR